MSSSSSSSCFGFKRGFLNTKKPRRSATAAKVPSTSSIQDAPDDECVLCYYPLPRNIEQSTYKSCCGSTICAGCINAQKRVRVIGTNVKLPIAGSKEEKREFIKIICYSLDVCPFCRASDAVSHEEHFERLVKHIDDRNDPSAIYCLASHYVKGTCGLSVNLEKARELYQRAYDLGDPDAAFDLFILHTEHFTDQTLAMKYLEEGAKRGVEACMVELAGRLARFVGNLDEAKRLTVMAACSGDDDAMEHVKNASWGIQLTKDEFDTTVRAHRAAKDKETNEPREYAMRLGVFYDTEWIIKYRNRTKTK